MDSITEIKFEQLQCLACQIDTTVKNFIAEHGDCDIDKIEVLFTPNVDSRKPYESPKTFSTRTRITAGQSFVTPENRRYIKTP